MRTHTTLNSLCGGLVTAALVASLPSLAQTTGHQGSHGSGPAMHGDSHGSMPTTMHGGGHGPATASEIGEPGKATDVSRTVEITITDNRFTPETIAVKKGETVRFAIANKGRLVHEFNIGTAAMHARHQKDMAVMVEHGALEPDRINHARMKMDMGGGRTMEHNEPNSVLVEPGKSAEILWKFSTDATLEFACNVPGHYDSGMMGHIRIQ